jgi:hypothetical protein
VSNRTIILSVVLLMTSLCEVARAYEPDESCCNSRPSLISHGFLGLVTGALFGLSAGYLVERGGGIHDHEWKTLVFGSGIGLLSGAAVGVGLGFWDSEDDRYCYGRYLLRDMLYGGGFGALLGSAAGGLAVLETKKGEHVLLGAAIGLMAGVGIGAIIGVIEGQTETDRAFRKREKQKRPKPVTATVLIAQDADGHTMWGPAIAGIF